MEGNDDGIPDAEILEFKSRDDIKNKRKELREKLLRNFNDLCKKKNCNVIVDRRLNVISTNVVSK